MLTQTLSIAEAYEKKKERLAKEIASAIEGGPLSSPDIVQLVIWNVIVAYFISLTANATYPSLSDWITEKGRLTLLDLKIAENEVIKKVVLSFDQREAAKRQIIGILEEYGVATEKQDDIANQVINTLSSDDDS